MVITATIGKEQTRMMTVITTSKTNLKATILPWVAPCWLWVAYCLHQVLILSVNNHRHQSSDTVQKWDLKQQSIEQVSISDFNPWFWFRQRIKWPSCVSCHMRLRLKFVCQHIQFVQTSFHYKDQMLKIQTESYGILTLWHHPVWYTLI